ncbi:MAG TPA: sugar ABC transporter ATP-binding protein [Thermoclostridium caenicola]|nr:sugar ABC transporter ATP-binding protein [Thermoclostridium caenicola]HOK43478.1 sugar ABC transporter ATP-binding protein [Thermoclostridium caenicola]HOL84126.1 sugar ABC transporter ATP-binding protein [Thermoclostridium caenicola]HPO76188.1 sugar ABC transporter ATP-binding protein [Thermoclostridium caenicola]
MANGVLLQMKNIHKTFPGVYALKAVDFELRAGEVHAILGENGAGKSTLIKILGGIYTADQGEIYIEGKKVDIREVHDAQKYGISIIHQELVLVPYMTVAENIFLGREPVKGGLVNAARMYEEAQRLIDSYGVNISAKSMIRDLTIAQQQLVEIIKAISYNSKILVMDEPTSSISEKEVKFLFETMRNLTAKGVGIIYISHRMSELAEICDRVTVMRDGSYIGTKVVRETTNDELIAMMVGRELKNYYTRDFKKDGEVILKCENISDRKMVKGVSFEVKKGEIVGFAGLVGAGRSELMKCLFGLTREYTGDIYIDGKKVVIRSPADAIKQGIALVPEDRKLEGLFHVQSVRFNSTIVVLKEFIRGIAVNRRKEEEITQAYIDRMSTKTPSMEQAIGKLSGGNQQKVMIGRWLATSPKILILDEPTRGVDVGAKSEIYAIMNDLAKSGMAIIMISSEMPELINMSDRIYVMCEGRITGCLNHEEVTQEKIMRLAAK